MFSLQVLRDSLQGLIAEPHDPEYSVKRWAANAERPAKFVVYPKSAEDVSKAIRFAQAENLEVAIRSGGHSFAGASSVAGGLVIDLSKSMNDVRIDPENRLAYAQGGATCKTLDQKAIEHGLAAVTGTVNHIGIGGFTTSGGWGWLTGEHGLAIDNVVSATVVVASGEILKASATENPDLFWGIRGGGSNFGVVTEFVYKLHPQREDVYTSFLVYPPNELGKLITETNLWLKERSAKEPGGILLVADPTGQPIVCFLGIYNGDSDEGKAKYQRFVDIGPVHNDSKVVRYPALNEIFNPNAEYGQNYLFKGILLDRVDSDVLDKVSKRWQEILTQEPEFQRSCLNFELRPYEKVAAVARDATAYVHRDRGHIFGIIMQWEKGDLEIKAREHIREIAALVLGTPGGQELPLIGAPCWHDDEAVAPVEQNRAREMFGTNYERLQKVKRQYDPQNVFHKWFPVSTTTVL